MSRSAAVRQILLEILRNNQETPDKQNRSVKLLLDNCILEGTLDPDRNERLLKHAFNGFSEPVRDDEILVLLDVAIRPLSDPEVHVGLNELKLFMDTITGIIS